MTELVRYERAAPIDVAVPAVPWEEALETFLDTLDSRNTRAAYRRDVGEAMDTLGVTYPGELTPQALASYRADLVARLDSDGDDRLAPATVKRKLDVLRSFLKFCRLTGILAIHKDVLAFTLKAPRAHVRRPYQVLSGEERRRLLEAAKERNARDYALVMLALGAGLRVSELVRVKLADFYKDDAGGWWIRVVQGKGRKDRLVPLSRDVMGAVRQLARSTGRSFRRKGDLDTYLFTTRQSERMTRVRALQVVKELAWAAGIEKPISPHSLRHTFAVASLRRGASPVVVQKLLGHSQLQTTERYLDHLELEDLREWAFSPAGGSDSTVPV